MHLLKQLNHEQLTMSSREIAQLCGKRHDNICRDIEKLNQIYGQLGLLKIEEGYYTHPNTGSQQYREFHLKKEQCIDLVTGYNAELRIKINRRWLELENRDLTKLEILQLALESEQQKIDLQNQLNLAAPKVDFYDALADRQNLMNATQLAQKFKKSAVAFNKILESFDVYNRCVKRGRVFQQWFIDQGLGELKETALGFAQPMFTTKGEQWVFNKFASEGII